MIILQGVCVFDVCMCVCVCVCVCVWITPCLLLYSGKSFREDTDGRGNVDRDSDDEGEKEEMEEFRPQYESLPALRPAQPPQYKPSPAYNQQYGELICTPGVCFTILSLILILILILIGVGDDDIVKMPPPETDFEMQQYRPVMADVCSLMC